MLLREKLLLEKEKLERVAEIARKGLEDAPDGSLKFMKNNGTIQYYSSIEGNSHLTYIQKSNMQLARRLAQKAYDEKILKYAENTVREIDRLLKIYEDDRVEEIYLQEHAERRKLITPVEPTYGQKLDAWMAEPYVGRGFSDGTPVILTNAGIRVRSKSEKIIADYFEAEGISYKYECPVVLKPYGTVYPDFTFLSRTTGRKIYWEHEGMLDNPEYAKAAAKKIELYEKNGIFPGENLILTFETSASGMNMELVKMLAGRYLR